MADVMDPSKLKVAELRAELQSRGLDTKGNKPVLVERLRAALEEEAAEPEEGDEVGAGEEEEEKKKKKKKQQQEEEEEGQEEEVSQEPEKVEEEPPAKEAEPKQKESEADKKKAETPVKKTATPQKEPEPSPKKPVPEPSPQKSVPEPSPKKTVPEPSPKKTAPEPSPKKSVPEPSPKKPVPEPSPQKTTPEPSPKKPAPEPSPKKTVPEPSPKKTVPEPSPKKTVPEPSPKKTVPEPSPKKTVPEPSPKKTVPEPSPKKTVPEPSPKKAVPEPSKKAPEPVPSVKVEDEDSAKLGYEDAPMEELADKGEAGNGMDVDVKEEDAEVKEEPVEVKQEEQENEEGGTTARRGEKRALSRSRSPEAKKQRPEVEVVRIEDEPAYDKTVVALDWYNSDLSLVISKEDFLSAQPLTMQGFGYVWHGVRATYGFTRGRVFFEVKVEDYLPVPQLEEEEQHPHVVRVGWSVDDAGLTLGEDPFSYGYGGTGKASTNLKFKDYGKTFGKGDVLGCFLDLEAEPVVMSFTVNGQHQGIAYEVSHSDLGDQALFPHIVTKNASFKANFGTESAWMEPLNGYTFTGTIPLEDRVLGSQGPEKREDAEVMMMVGLPAAGKTTWVEKHCRENLSKKFNVLGTNSLIDKMKVNGLPRRRNYAGRWEALIDRCTKCLNKLLELAYKRRRNFIIDQTNVYPSAQRRKMMGFAGFKRRAVVICPTDEDLKSRTEKREKEEGKDVPDKAVLEMKANFKLPEEGDLFDSVEFIETQQDESLKLVQQYNKEGEEAGFGQKKGFRGAFVERRGGGFMDRRGGYGNRGNSFRGGWDRDRRGGGGSYTERRDRGGGWTRDRDYSRGSYNREGSRGTYTRDYNRGGYNREVSRGGYNRDRGTRSSYQNSWTRTQQTTPASQSYSSYGNYNQGWGNQSYGYGQGYSSSSSSSWNQQYYQQPQQTPQTQQQQQQQYWGSGYGYGSQSYGSGQQYSTSSASQTSSSSSNWGQQGSWSGSGQQQWSGSNYKPTSWGGSGYSSSSGQRR